MVNRFRITLKNYRCFSEQRPLVIDLGRGVSALTGPNNVGKSALLKFFYEMRWLWNYVAWQNPIQLVNDPHGIRLELYEINDPTEIFNNRSSRPAIIRFEILDYEKPAQGSPVIDVSSSNAAQCSMQLWFEPPYLRQMEIAAM